MKRTPATIVLALVPSSTDSTKTYKISLDSNNAVFCTCRSWRYNGHRCKHLTAFRARLASKAVSR